MPSKLNVGSRLIFLVILMTIFMVAIGIIGLRATSTAVSSLETVYTDRTVPLASLAKVAQLFNANVDQVLRALQHNPSYEVAKLHDHPVSEHVKRIEASKTELDKIWAEYMATYLTPEEKQLAENFMQKRKVFLEETLLPTVQSLKNNDFSIDTTSRFLKGSRTNLKDMSEVLQALTDLQTRVAKEEFDRAEAQNSTARAISIGAIVGGVALGLLLAWWIIRSITGPLNQMRTTITEVEKSGDFTQRIPVHTEDEVGQTAKAFNELMTALQQTLGQVLGSVAKVSDAAQSLSAASGQVATSSSSQSEATSAMAAAVEEMTVSINHVSESAREAVEISRKSGKLSTEGGEIIHKASSEMSQIAETVRHTAQAIEELDQHSNQISSIVQVIKDVADQTNLLALNAAIEAARAGEQGRGFAVVADEVRKLAERTTKATEEITQMIAAMQHSAQAAVSTMETAVDQVSGGVALANQAGSAIIQIKDGAEQVVGVVNDISSALTEQSSASNDIASQVEKVAQMTEENSAAAAETASAANNLQELANT
ncbi:methyl-accepting chemotaxis protein, partial [Sulfuricella sp.]|uniref:methyl-accepting chemotaxis protein n=1 Tax=Sulfuricella sp. TaxID=2099377 RepID=UPI002D1068E7